MLPCGVCIFRNHRFACKRRLVNLQIHGAEQLTVGRNLVAHLYDQDVSHDNITPGNLLHTTVAFHFNGLFLIKRRQYTELSGCIALENEAYRRGEEYRNEDADGLDEVAFDKRQHERNKCREKQNLDHRVAIFIKIELPKRYAARRCKYIAAMQTPTGLYFRLRETAVDGFCRKV